MAMITDAALASEAETEAEGVAFAREVLRIEAEALESVRERLGTSIAQGGRFDLSLDGERDRHGHGQGGARRPETGGDPGLDRHPGLSSPSGRRRPRRPGPHPGRRRGDRDFRKAARRKKCCG